MDWSAAQTEAQLFQIVMGTEVYSSLSLAVSTVVADAATRLQDPHMNSRLEVARERMLRNTVNAGAQLYQPLSRASTSTVCLPGRRVAHRAADAAKPSSAAEGHNRRLSEAKKTAERRSILRSQLLASPRRRLRPPVARSFVTSCTPLHEPRARLPSQPALAAEATARPTLTILRLHSARQNTDESRPSRRRSSDERPPRGVGAGAIHFTEHITAEGACSDHARQDATSSRRWKMHHARENRTDYR